MSEPQTRRQAMRLAGGVAAAGLLASLGGDATVAALPQVPPGASLVGAPTGHDDGPVIQAVHDQIARDGGGTMTFLRGATYRLDTGVTFDPVRVSVLGDRTTFDATRLAEGTAVVLAGTRREPEVYTTPARCSFSGIDLVGPGSSSSVQGIETAGSSDGYTAGMAFYGVAVHDFGVGISIGSYSYINDFFNVSIYSCGRGLDDSNNLTDGGERITFVGSAIFNSSTALHLQVGTTDYTFLASSFDYNAKVAALGNGVHCTLVGCHVEMPTAGASDHLNVTVGSDEGDRAGTTFCMYGGFWAQTGGGQSPRSPVTMTLRDPGSLVAFYGVAFNGVAVANGRFVSGGGRSSVLNPLPDTASAATDFGPVLVSRGQSVVAGSEVDREAATGFLHLPTVAGPPIGVPAPEPGTVPVVYDTTTNRLFAYNGGWRPL